jgi:TatD DNase family protein
MPEQKTRKQEMGGLMDTHTHLCDDSFDRDRGEVIDRAGSAGVSFIIAVGETLKDGKKNLQLAENYPQILPGAGLYPTHLDLSAAMNLKALIEKERERLACIGEVGLDYWVIKDEEEREMQREIFSLFIELGKALDLPLNVHARSAGRHAIDILLKKGAAKVQLHAFDGKAATAQPAVEAGYFFSIPPSIVHSRQKQKLVKNLPLSCLLLETDSPVLGPTPGERNEPANTLIPLHAIAEIKGLSRDAVREAVIENTRRLYGCP